MAISVLIVEDDPNIRELLQLYLEKDGYAVTLASDGGQGLAKFRAIKPNAGDGRLGSLQGHPRGGGYPGDHAHRKR